MSEETAVPEVEEETQQEEEESTNINPLSMSDEEIMDYELAEEKPIVEEEEQSTEETEEEVKEEVEKATEPDVFSGTEEQVTEPKEKAKKQSVDATVDYEAEYKRMLAPFRANGKELQVNNVDDAIALMQMGANYNKKLASLKPSLKIVKMLDNNDLLDEAKLSYLIDLSKKDPKAITKLVTESDLDPLDIDPESAEDYKPAAYTVDDKELELDGILDEIRETDSYAKTLDIVGNKWDESSKQVLLESPEIIRVINDHVGNGVYDQVARVIESERMLGRLQGLTDIQAYKQVGDALSANGNFNNQAPTAARKVVKPTKKVKSDPKLISRKKAAASTRGNTKGNSLPNDFNPLSMSDEEISKMVIPGVL